MKPWQYAVVGLALLATSGCRSDPNVAILERQLRLQEDEIYRLRDTVRDLRECPQSGEERPARASRATEAAEPESAGVRRRDGSTAPGNSLPPPKIELPSQPERGVPDRFKPPPDSAPLNVPEVPEQLRGPSKSSGPSMDGPILEREAGGVSARPHSIMLASRAGSAAPFTPSGDSRRAAAIVLNRSLTGGINAGDRSGDQGLLVVVEPRDRAGRTVDAPADMSIVVYDSALRDADGHAALVARWDFAAAETAAMFRRTGATGAIHLMMTWPDEPPKHSKLHLFVRYVTADGRKLEANQPIEVALAGDKTARWNPAEASARAARPADREPAPEAWQPDEFPAARVPGPSPYMAARSDVARPSRPIWSPERQ